ncbi:hepatocyte growth factor receptor [Aplysia californica]|uniref:receptor protein-tyrosine kinase n=1 Tax=Aplysia californica TaxID=6500 RepID=A0ABM1ADF6_APLCA|nr:hepatocyte growth factor receptor [Aplysia californica]
MDRDVALSECDLTQSGKCPPRLTSFSPIFAPVAGGTRLNLVGHNMGSAGEGTVNVTVCNQTCSDVAPNVNSLHCTLPAKCATCSDGCPVTVIAVAKQGTVDVRSTIPQRLHYQSPNVTSFNPICGPVSGGTTLVISGQHLTIGSQAVVTVAGRECTLLSRQGEDLKCIIGPSANKTISCGKVNVTIDWHQVPQSNKTFCFTPDPVVESLTPNGTIESGGIEIVVRGQGFQHVGYAELALVLSVYNKDSNKTLQFPFRSRCDLTGSENEFRCTTPNLRNVTQVHYGRMFRDTAAGVRLVMDGFDGLAKSPRLSSMTVYRDPDLLTTSTELHISGRKPFLTIRGEHIPQSLGLNQFSVTVGNTTCEVTSVTHDKIVCDAYDVLVKYRADQENKHGGGYEIDGQSGKNWTSSENTTLSGNTTATATTTNTTTVTAAATTTLSPNASSEAVVVSSGPWPTTTTSRVSFDNNSSTPEVGRTLGDFLTLRGRAVGSGSSTPQPHWYAIRARRAERRRRRRRNREPQLYTLVVKIGNYEKEGKVQVGPRWNQTEVPLDSSPFLTQPTIIALGAGGGILLLMIVLVAVCCRVHAKAKKERKLAETFSNLGSSKGSAEGAVPSLKQILESVVEPGRRADLDRLIIDLDRLTVGNSIGSGNFGCVYEGMLNVSPDTPAVRVAVKTLQDPSYRVMDLKGFVQEAVLMKDFRHPHVLGLIGLAEKAPGIPYVVLPYMENGDLLTYIRDPSVILSLHDVIKFGADIASGMDYLSGLKFVHRDLAARNCMLGSDERVKVADFGLCRDIYEKGYYSSDNKKKLPIRWMAVESIEHGAYSTKSDVWSLGVVLWELLTRGVTPYPGVDGWDVINFLRRRRLAPPHFCPDRMYRLMLNCWAKNPTSRPTFKNIRMELLTMIGEDPFSTAPATPEPSAPSTPDPSRCGLDLQPPKSPARGGAAGSFDKAAQKPDSSSGGKTTSPTTGGKKPVPLPRGIPPKSKSSQDSGAAATAAKLRHPTSEDNNNGVGGGGVMTAGVVGGGSERSAARAKTHSDIMSVPKPSVVENVAITIPACYNHREVSKSAAADYLTLVDNYEAPPKFSNPLLRSKNRHGRKSNRSRKEKSSGSGKGRGAAATRNSGYLEVHGMQPSSVVGALASQSFEMTVLSTDPSGHTRSLLVDQRNKDNTYYDLETFDMDDTDGEYQSDRSSNVTSSHHDSSVASMLDSRYSAGSFVDSRYSSSAVGSHHASDSSLGSTPHAGGERLRVSSLHVPQRRTSPRQDVPGRGSTNVLDISEESSQHNSYEATSL